MPTRAASFNRRHALQGLAATAAASAIVSPAAAPQASAAPPALPPLPEMPRPEFPRPSLHVYDSYGWLRGFNCIPSWGARIEDAWWFYDAGKMREEMALARSVHANAICLWIEFTAWFRDPAAVTRSFLDAVAAIDEHGMKVMPCLFNRWHDATYDYGGTHIEDLAPGMPSQLEYVRALVTPLAADPRVFCWNLCNEPQAAADPTLKKFGEELCRREYQWLMGIAETVKACGARQPLTIGTMNGANITFYAPLVDVLCAHPYARDRAGLEAMIRSFTAIVAAEHKPLLVNECVPGCDVDEIRGETHRYYRELLAAAGYGSMAWSIREGRSIAARRDRMDGNGINGKGYHPTFNADGSLRRGHDWMRDKPAQAAPWETG